jgi:hypothetical protein
MFNVIFTHCQHRWCAMMHCCWRCRLRKKLAGATAAVRSLFGASESQVGMMQATAYLYRLVEQCGCWCAAV